MQKKLCIAFVLFVIAAFSQTLFAQGLNWEGQTGAVITPFAYTAASTKIGKPEASFHYLNAGSVIGNDFQFSVTEGFYKRFEAGITQSFSSAGNVVANTPGGIVNVNQSASGYTTVQPDSLAFSNGYTTLHGKVTVIPENAFKMKWIPAIAVGATGRFGVQRASFYLADTGARSVNQTNGDFYVVATKTVTQFKPLPFLLSFGEKVTDASLFGIAGNAGNRLNGDQRWQGRLFGAAAIVVKAPAKTTLILGSEAVQQPKYVQGLNTFSLVATGSNAVIPTSMTYFVRIVPHMEGSPLQVDLACVQAAGNIAKFPGGAVALNAKSQFGMGVSYHF